MFFLNSKTFLKITNKITNKIECVFIPERAAITYFASLIFFSYQIKDEKKKKLNSAKVFLSLSHKTYIIYFSIIFFIMKQDTIVLIIIQKTGTKLYIT